MPGKCAVEKTVSSIEKFRDGPIMSEHMAHKMVGLALHGTLEAIT